MIGACAGLTGLSVAVLAGLAADNRAESVLMRALVAMVVCQAVGWVIGAIGERTIREALRGYQESNPLNTSSTSPGAEPVDRGPVGVRSA